LPVKISQRAEYAILSRLLTEARERSGLSQSELARRLGRRQVYIWRVENALQSPDLIELGDIAQVLGVDVLEIVRQLQGQSPKPD
jgi:transcriptional regulator with XRE-family HTH domain